MQLFCDFGISAVGILRCGTSGREKAIVRKKDEAQWRDRENHVCSVTTYARRTGASTNITTIRAPLTQSYIFAPFAAHCRCSCTEAKFEK